MESAVVRDVMLWSEEKRSLPVDERICLVLRCSFKQKSFFLFLYLFLSGTFFILGFSLEVAEKQASFGQLGMLYKSGSVPPTPFFMGFIIKYPSWSFYTGKIAQSTPLKFNQVRVKVGV